MDHTVHPYRNYFSSLNQHNNSISESVNSPLIIFNDPVVKNVINFKKELSSSDLQSSIIKLQNVDIKENSIGITGRNNSIKTAKIQSQLRAVNIELASFGLDGNNPNFKNTLWRTKIYRCITNIRKRVASTFTNDKVFDVTKNAAKVTQNYAKFGNNIPFKSADDIEVKLLEASQTKSADIEFQSTITGVALAEYISGLSISLLRLSEIRKRNKKANESIDKVVDLTNRAKELLVLKSEKLEEHFKLNKNNSFTTSVIKNGSKEIENDIQLLDLEFKKVSNEILLWLHNNQLLSDAKDSKNTAYHIVKAARYCGSMAAVSMLLGAKLCTGDVVEPLLLGGYAVGGGSGGTALSLDLISLNSAIKKRNSHKKIRHEIKAAIIDYKARIEFLNDKISDKKQEIDSIFDKLSSDDKEKYSKLIHEYSPQNSSKLPKKIIKKVNEIGKLMQENAINQQELSIASMIYKKQPGWKANDLNVVSKFLTTGGYLSGTVSAVSAITVLTGVGGASIIVFAGPLGWGLGGTGALIGLGLASNKVKNYYGHKRHLRKLINKSIGNTKETKNQIFNAKADSPTWGKAHSILMNRLSYAEKLSSISSRAGGHYLFDQLIQEFSTLLESDEYFPEIDFSNTSKSVNSISLKNPLNGIGKYIELRNNSRTYKFINKIHSETDQSKIDNSFDQCIECLRVGHINSAKSILANLLNIKI